MEAQDVPKNADNRNPMGCGGRIAVVAAWAFLGLVLAGGTVQTMGEAWQKEGWDMMNDPPAGIVMSVALGTVISMVISSIAGWVLASWRARQWGAPSAFWAGILGPLIAFLGAQMGAAVLPWVGIGYYVGALAGLAAGIQLGKSCGTRKPHSHADQAPSS